MSGIQPKIMPTKTQGTTLQKVYQDEPINRTKFICGPNGETQKISNTMINILNTLTEKVDNIPEKFG